MDIIRVIRCDPPPLVVWETVTADLEFFAGLVGDAALRSMTSLDPFAMTLMYADLFL